MSLTYMWLWQEEVQSLVLAAVTPPRSYYKVASNSWCYFKGTRTVGLTLCKMVVDLPVPKPSSEAQENKDKMKGKSCGAYMD